MIFPLENHQQQSERSFCFKTLKDFIERYLELFLIVGVLLGYAAYLQYDKKLMFEVYENPRKSDFLYIDYIAIDPSSDRKFRYIPMKILSVEQNGVNFKVGNIAHSSPVSPYVHAKYDKAVTLRNYFKSDALFLSHSRLKSLIESGDIYNARRPDNIYIGGWVAIPLSELY